MNIFEMTKRSLLIVALLLVTTASWASSVGGDVPWAGPLQKIIDILQGSVLPIIAVIAIIGAGCAIAFTEVGPGLKNLLKVIIGLSIAFGAASIVLNLFGVSSGAAF